MQNTKRVDTMKLFAIDMIFIYTHALQVLEIFVTCINPPLIYIDKTVLLTGKDLCKIHKELIYLVIICN